MIALPEEAEDFIRLAKGISLLEAIMSPDWEFRYFSFNPKWAPSEVMASMRDGSGNQWFAIVSDGNIAITGSLAGKSGQSGIFNELPVAFTKNLAEEPAFLTKESCFCFWKLKGQPKWMFKFSETELQNDVAGLFSSFSDDPEKYVAFAKVYYEKDIALDLVRKALRNDRISFEEIVAVNSDIEIESWNAEIGELEYGTGI